MIRFSIIIACVAHSTVCSLPALVFGHFEAENREMCERNVRLLVAADGLRDFIVTCSDRRA
jgi:hypothetical protein